MFILYLIRLFITSIIRTIFVLLYLLCIRTIAIKHYFQFYIQMLMLANIYKSSSIISFSRFSLIFLFFFLSICSGTIFVVNATILTTTNNWQTVSPPFCLFHILFKIKCPVIFNSLQNTIYLLMQIFLIVLVCSINKPFHD